jgi:prevent-host-death family protein
MQSAVLNFLNSEVIIMRQVTISEASQNLSDLIEAVINGEEIIIMKDDKPAVKLIPVLPVKIRPKFGSAEEI